MPGADRVKTGAVFRTLPMPDPLREPPPLPVVVVGAGPAGLSVAAELAKRGIRATVLEAGPEPGWSWRGHYPWLRLHTTRRDSSLPGRSMPRGDGGYPSRSAFADYLAEYADGLDADLRLSTPVTRLERDPEGLWTIVPEDGTELRARHLVLATGWNRRPVRPPIPGERTFEGTVVHSTDWRTLVQRLGGDVDPGTGEPRGLAGRRILVVGLGNTGADLAEAFHAAGARVAVAVRSPIHLVPMELLGLNWRTWYRLLPGAAFAVGGLGGPLGRRLAARAAAGFWSLLQRMRFGDLERRGLPLQRTEQILDHWRQRRPPLTAGAFVDLLRMGEIAALPALEALESETARLAGGRSHRCEGVILATGFRPAWDELLAPPPGARTELADAYVGAEGRQLRPGLWLCGSLPEVLRIRRSARRIARGITGKL